MHSKVNKLVRSLTGAVLVASVAVASFMGCTTGQTENTDGMRDGNDINTFETTEETEPEATPTPTNTPTPTPSPTPAIPHMNMPDVDTTAPFFLTLPESVSIENGSEFDINRHIGYIDDCDSNVDLQIDGEVDTSEDGSYALSLTITDDAGNSKTGSMTVNVYTPSSSGGGGGGGSSEHTTLAYSDFIDRYPAADIAHGIDVSRYQGDIDFEAVKAAGCDFVMLRAMIYNNGELGVDRKFEEYYADAKAAGLLIGVYYYSTDSTIEMLHEHCDELLAVLDGKELDLPVAFDWESWAHFQKYQMSIIDINNLFYEFAGIMEENGYSTILYSSKYYLEIIWEPAGYDVWLAHYVKETSYEGDYTMWQTGSIGRIDGCDEDVDTDILFKSRYPELFGGT
ncbi:MAG: GH25 family lysozyme [Eubacteriales bacterium]|nr:GH25 family lysozyme [Eubacteriales bacterium]